MAFLSVYSHVIKPLGCTYPLTSSIAATPVPDSGRDRRKPPDPFAVAPVSFPPFLSRRCYSPSLSPFPSSRSGGEGSNSVATPLAAIRRIPIQARQLDTPPTQRCDFSILPASFGLACPTIGSFLDPGLSLILWCLRLGVISFSFFGISG
jgi:hypothetical protein